MERCFAVTELETEKYNMNSNIQVEFENKKKEGCELIEQIDKCIYRIHFEVSAETKNRDENIVNKCIANLSLTK